MLGGFGEGLGKTTPADDLLALIKHNQGNYPDCISDQIVKTEFYRGVSSPHNLRSG